MLHYLMFRSRIPPVLLLRRLPVPAVTSVVRIFAFWIPVPLPGRARPPARVRRSPSSESLCTGRAGSQHDTLSTNPTRPCRRNSNPLMRFRTVSVTHGVPPPPLRRFSNFAFSGFGASRHTSPTVLQKHKSHTLNHLRTLQKRESLPTLFASMPCALFAKTPGVWGYWVSAPPTSQPSNFSIFYSLL